MHEDVLRAVIGRDEPVALVVAKPLYGSSRHALPPHRVLQTLTMLNGNDMRALDTNLQPVRTGPFRRDRIRIAGVRSGFFGPNARLAPRPRPHLASCCALPRPYRPRRARRLARTRRVFLARSRRAEQ